MDTNLNNLCKEINIKKIVYLKIYFNESSFRSHPVYMNIHKYMNVYMNKKSCRNVRKYDEKCEFLIYKKEKKKLHAISS